jgi:chorismate--pyruvate lyase
LIFPADPALRHWLQAEGSLTARLRRFGHVQVLVQQQAAMPLWPLERVDLKQRSGYVREVVLLLNGRPAVWARSATSLTAIEGPWHAMRGLGTRPLAELLFATRHVQRAPLQMHHLPKRGVMHNHIGRQWSVLEQEHLGAAMPQWARSSVFWRKGQGLRVMEAFSPWVCTPKEAFV